MNYLEYPTKESIEALCRDLNLPQPDKFSQDWEYETSDVNRIKEFIAYYRSNDLNDETKFTLMMVIINSCNDALNEGAFDLNIWEELDSILLIDRIIHLNTIKYWICDEDDDIEDCFHITPYIRKTEARIIEIEKIRKLDDLL